MAAAFDRREADRLLIRLLELVPDERRAALAAVRDDSLRAAVRRLLRAAETPSDVLDSDETWTQGLWADLARDTARQESPLTPGDRVGPYRVLEEIERGGMAVVYRAERADGELERQVAVKVLKLGLDTEEVVRRFEQERQILADLDHPGIARLYDAGRTDDGRPYFVMELVEGLPIDRYCDENRLSIDERLEMFRVVAEAVDCAHRNLVVHRDLKPSNILIGDAGQVKLLDFGIARLLDVEAGGSATAPPTRTSVRMMTPEYASPEQVRGDRVTPASDVYQLGLLLYELLTGRRAYPLSTHGPGEIERTICDQTPTRPSSAVTRDDPRLRPGGTSRPSTSMEVSSARDSSPTRLRRRLRGDLDNIVLKALRKEPERRYRSADHLVQDLRRHLRGLPVTARADTTLYRARKFLVRHPISVTASALVLILVTGMIAFYTARIRSERDRAQAAADQAAQVSQFLARLFKSADPRESRDAELTARELLDLGVAQVETELSGQPEIQAQLLRLLGEIYIEKGIYDSADRALERALDLYRRRFGSRHREIGVTLGDLGLLAYRQADLPRAKQILTRASRVLETSAEEDSAELAVVLKSLGGVLWNLGERREGRAALERSLAIHSRVSGADSEPAASTMNSLASMLSEQGDLQHAEQLYGRALAIFERALGSDHPGTGAILMNLANVRVKQGKLADVEAMYHRSLTIFRQAYGADHLRVGGVLNNFGDFLVAACRNDEAVTVLRQSLDVFGRLFGPDDPRLAFPLITLGDAQLAVGRLAEAAQAYRQSVTVLEASPGVKTFELMIAYSLVKLGGIATELGNDSVAEPILDRAAALWGRAPEDVDPSFAPALVNLGRWLTERQRCGEAIPLLRRAADLHVATPAASGTPMAKIDSLLATCSETRPITAETLN